MQMVRLNITKRHNPAVTKPDEEIDLDEKIRRIREANKAREQRFKEIEQDKKLAQGLMVNEDSSKGATHSIVEGKQPRNSSMKGVKLVVKNISKGRGQRLVQLTNCALKASSFEAKTREECKQFEQSMPENIKLKNNCRTKIKEKIKNKKSDAVVDKQNKNNPDIFGNTISPQLETDHSDAEEKLDCIPENQHEISAKEAQQNIENDSGLTTQKSLHIKGQTVEETESTTRNEDNIEETDKILGSVDEQKTNTTQRKSKPKITVKLKKSSSNSSFDESMAMMSPLDVPQNWGDLDFSDEELPPVSIWKN